MNPILRALMQSLHFGPTVIPTATRSVVAAARQFGTTTVREAPCRYDDPHVVARRVLTEKKLDRYCFPTWQDLINHFAFNGDAASAYASFHFARADKEYVVMPHISNHKLYVQNVYQEDDYKMPEELDTYFSKLHKAADWCVENLKLDHYYFKSPKELTDYWMDVDDVRKIQRALNIEKMYPKKN